MVRLLKKLFGFTRTTKSKVNADLYRLLRMNRRMISPRK